MTNDVDVIVIGSGAGGMTAAVALAQAGKKVLVCEQHYVAGGWTHTFTLQGYRFSPGVHYIGGIGEGGMMRSIYEGLGVSRDLTFVELNPDGFDHVLVGDSHDSLERFAIPKGIDTYKAKLKERFPHESKGIDSFFDTAIRAVEQTKKLMRIRRPIDAISAPFRAPSAVRWLLGSAQSMVDSHVSDPFLKAILLSQTGDHGMPPSMASGVLHAMVMSHYFDGGYYPLGGAFAIPRAYVRALRRAGGEIRLSTSVEQILIENRKAVGVRLGDGTEVRAETIVSNADSEVTLGRLVGRQHLSPRTRRKLDRMVYSTSALSLFFATDLDMSSAGVDSGNMWYYRTPDVDGHYKRGLTGDIVEGKAPVDSFFLTTTTLKDPSKKHSGHHTCEAFTFTSYEPFRKWEEDHKSEGGPPKSADYLSLKEELMDKMFGALETVVPGISSHVVFAELGTPLSNRHYINATDGNLYGTDKRTFQLGPYAFPIKSEIEGLYMVGASTASGHGVAGVTASGMEAAKQILRARTRDILNQNGPSLEVYPSEDPSVWPEKLRERIARSGDADTGEDEIAEIKAH